MHLARLDVADLLPLLTNGIGDWLCARVGADSSIVEVVHWYHGGGDYMPYGSDLAQAITFANLADRFPWKRRDHAIPAQPAKVDSNWSSGISRWALQFLPDELANELRSHLADQPWVDHLLEHGVAWEGIQCERVLSLVDNELRSRLQPSHVNHLDLNWDREVVRWMFDPQTIPEPWVGRLPVQVSRGEELDRRWQQAGEICHEVLERRSDLAWAWDIYGWSCHRRGDQAGAINAFAHSAQTSVFSDQSIRFRTHFDSTRFAKFSVARLADLDATNHLDPRYCSALAGVAQPAWRRGVTSYWNDQASTSTSHESRYDLYFRGGWDVGCESMRDYHYQLSQLVVEAQASGQAARAEVAMTHLNCLEERYLLERH